MFFWLNEFCLSLKGERQAVKIIGPAQPKFTHFLSCVLAYLTGEMTREVYLKCS